MGKITPQRQSKSHRAERALKIRSPSVHLGHFCIRTLSEAFAYSGTHFHPRLHLDGRWPHWRWGLWTFTEKRYQEFIAKQSDPEKT
jgi:hypothetical protein